MGKDHNLRARAWGKDMPLCEHIQQATFPGVQGTPYFNHIAAKAVFFKETLSNEYKTRQFKVIKNAKRLAHDLVDLGYDVLTGGTDNHMVLINAANSRKGLTGVAAQKCLEDCGIIVDKIKLPFDKKPASVTSGIRLGTPIVTRQRMTTEQMDEIAGMIDSVLRQVKVVSDTEYKIDESFTNQMRSKIKNLLNRFPTS
jgi:glycine hydroxymethyltransferase